MITIENLGSGSSGNAYIVKNENTTILLECGLPYNVLIQKIYTSTGRLVTELDGIVVTHKHEDHILSLQRLSEYTKVFASESVIDKKRSKWLKIEPLKSFYIDTIYLYPINVNHGETPCLAFILKDKDSCIFFGTDFNLMTWNLKNIPFTEIFIECNYCEELIKEKLSNEEEKEHMKVYRQINSHMSLENCIHHLQNMNLSKCKKITLIHLSDSFGNITLMKDKVFNAFNIPTFVALKKGGYF